MEKAQLLEDIHELNLSYLLLVQRLIITDRDDAMTRLRIDETMANLLSRLPISKLAPLARCNQLLCHFAINDAAQFEALVEANSPESMRDVHAAIVLKTVERKNAETPKPAVKAKSSAKPVRKRVVTRTLRLKNFEPIDLSYGAASASSSLWSHRLAQALPSSSLQDA